MVIFPAVAINGLTNTAQSNVLTVNTTTGQLYYTASSAIGGGGGGTPAPSDTFIQYNSGSVFGATGSFRFIHTSESLQQGHNIVASGPFSHAEGFQTLASGWYSHAEGWGALFGLGNIASGTGSHAEGSGTQAKGFASHAEGSATIASGSTSHAEGWNNKTLGDYSHAEGGANIAVGGYSHAEGNLTITSGSFSHTEGQLTTTLGDFSHAEGYWTIAVSAYQHTQGILNLPVSGAGAFIHGNGTSNANRSNLIYASGSEFQLTGSLRVTGSVFIKELTDTAQSNVLTINTTTGQVSSNVWYRIDNRSQRIYRYNFGNGAYITVYLGMKEFQVTRPGADLTGNLPALNIARVLIVLALADISLRAIEIPIRNGVVQNWFRGMKYRTKIMQKRQRIFVASVTAFMVVISGSSVALAWQRDQSIIVEIKPELELPDTVMGVSKSGLWVTGDSVILGIRSKLAMQEEIALINARVGRQIQELIKEVEADKPRAGESKVVLNVGNNNSVSREDMFKLMELLKDQPKVVVVNTSVPRTWRDGNNKIISEVVSSYPNAVLVDWASIAENHPEFFAPDGVHLIEAGSDVYVASILEALNAD